jgi:thiosulfate reductase cytochrome b subunit
LRESHTISTGKAVLAVFLPLIVAVGLGILAMSLVPFLFRTLGFLGGVGA